MGLLNGLQIYEFLLISPNNSLSRRIYQEFKKISGKNRAKLRKNFGITGPDMTCNCKFKCDKISFHMKNDYF